MRLIDELRSNFTLERLQAFDYITALVFALSLFRFKRLIGIERLIILIPILNFLLIGLLYGLYPKGSNNLLVINLMEIVFGIVYFIIFFISFKMPSKKIISLICLIAFPLAHLFNIFFGQGPNMVTTLTTIPQYLIISIFCYARIREMILEDEIKLENLEFWFLLGSLIYFVLPLSQIALEPYLNSVSPKLSSQIGNIEIITVYLFDILFILGLLWKKPRSTYSLS